jgi:hypothetical protein
LILFIIDLRYANYKGVIKPDVISNFNKNEGVGFLTFTTGFLRNNKLWAFNIGRDLVITRGRVLTFLFRLVRFL